MRELLGKRGLDDLFCKIRRAFVTLVPLMCYQSPKAWNGDSPRLHGVAPEMASVTPGRHRSPQKEDVGCGARPDPPSRTPERGTPFRTSAEPCGAQAYWSSARMAPRPCRNGPSFHTPSRWARVARRASRDGWRTWDRSLGKIYRRSARSAAEVSRGRKICIYTT